MELILVAVVAVLGLIVGLAAIRDSMVSEMADVGGAIQELNQSFSVSGVDYSRDVDGNITINFGVAPTDEGGFVPPDVPPDGGGGTTQDWVKSEIVIPGGFTNQTTTSVEGTIGDATASTTFTYSTDTGVIRSTNGTGEIRISESNGDPGTYTIAFDDPVVDLEFWVRDFTHSSGSNPENVLGNFTLTLSDGTVLNDAAFTVIPDAIAPNTSYGPFSTSGNDRELISAVVRGGNSFITDPNVNGSGNQAAGRITFDNGPTCPPGTIPANPVGISSISFERRGGAGNASMHTSFSASVLNQQ